MVIIFLTIGTTLFAQTIANQDFEAGIGNWWVDNGLWEVGIPTVGPDSACSGQNCAGTVLGGNYPGYASTRLISPYIVLPSISSGEYIKLKFWQWFRLNISAHGNDYSYVQISVNGGSWQTIAGPFSGYGYVWSQGSVDLSAYADSTVRIAFYFTSNWVYEDNGWYIDDVSITVGKPIFNNPEDFEQGTGDWSADNGLWEVGVPTVGPDSAHSGQNCAGTVLHGNYPGYAGTRLISPQITLTPDQGSFIELYYWHWFRFNVSAHGNDLGYVQVSVDRGPWQTVAGPISGTSTVWTQGYVDLSAYADSTVRIAFYFTSNWVYEDNGWYIDDVRLENVTGVEEDRSIYFNDYVLDQNYPNPFNPVTHIRFGLPAAKRVKIQVFNMLGQKVATLVDVYKPAGFHTVQFDGSNFGSGLYYYKIQAGQYCQSRKMVLIR